MFSGMLRCPSFSPLAESMILVMATDPSISLNSSSAVEELAAGNLRSDAT